MANQTQVQVNQVVADIISRVIEKENPNFTAGGRVPHFNEAVGFLHQRFLAVPADPEITEDLSRTVSELRTVASGIQQKTLERACSDRIIRDSLRALKNNSFSCKEILETFTKEVRLGAIPKTSSVKTTTSDRTSDGTAFLTAADQSRIPVLSNRTTQTEELNDLDFPLAMTPISARTPKKYTFTNDNGSGADVDSARTKYYTAGDNFPSYAHQQTNQAQFNQNANRYHSTPFINNFNSTSRNSTFSSWMHLSFRDALDLIPKFDGHNLPLATFVHACKEARQMIPQASEEDLSRLIRARLTGLALKSVHNKAFMSFVELKNHLYSRFGTLKTFACLQGELDALRQGRDECVLAFSNRVSIVADELLEAAHRENRVVNNFAETLERDKVRFFTRGLHWVIKSHIGRAESLDEATSQAIEIERDFKCHRDDASEKNYGAGAVLSKTNERFSNINLFETNSIERCANCARRERIEAENRQRNNGYGAGRDFGGNGPSRGRPPGEREPGAWSERWGRGDRAEVAGRSAQVQPPYTGGSRLASPARNNAPPFSTPPPKNMNTSRDSFTPNTQRDSRANNAQNRICNFCKKVGHWKNECRKLQFLENSKQTSQGNGLAYRDVSATRRGPSFQRS